MAGIPIASGIASVTANSTSANQVQNLYDYLFSSGTLYLYCRSSATGMQANLFVQGNTICKSLGIPFTGTAGALDTSAHLIAVGGTLGGRVELTFTNTTGGTLTVDFVLSFRGIPIAGGLLRRLSGR